MDFELSAEQTMFRDMAREFAKREIIPVVKEDDRGEYYRPEIIRKMAALGLLSGTIPREYGGLGIDYICYSLICEEIGGASGAIFASTLLAHVSLFQLAILEWGNSGLKETYLPHTVRGELLGCCALFESDISGDWANPEINAVPDGENYWVLNGSNKKLVTNGGVADLALVFAQTDMRKGNAGISAFLVEKGTAGFSSCHVNGKVGLRASNMAQLILEHSRVPAENLLGKAGDGFEIAMSSLDRAHLSLGAAAVGIAQACINASSSYARERRQFNRPISSFQLIQESIADMVIETEAARFLVYRLGHLMNRRIRATKEAAMAKAYATEVALRAASKAIQIHGAYGVSADYPLERYYRDAIALDILEGIPQNQKIIVGRKALEI